MITKGLKKARSNLAAEGSLSARGQKSVRQPKTYHRLKKNRGTVTIKVEEVLLPIFAQGRLTYGELRIALAIIADSWRWRNAPVTQRPLELAKLARVTGMHIDTVGRVLRSLIGRTILLITYGIKNHKPYASFNEHFEYWLKKPNRSRYQNWQDPELLIITADPEENSRQENQPQIGQNDGKKTPKDELSGSTDQTSARADESSVDTHVKAKDEKSLPIPKNNIKNNIKNNKESPVASRLCRNSIFDVD